MPGPRRVATGCRSGRLIAVLAAATGTWASAQVGDFDGDGKAELLLRDADGAWWHRRFETSATVAGRSRLVPLTTSTEWQWAANGDFDGDGRHDVLLRRRDGRWTFYPLNGAEVVEGRGWANLVRAPGWRVAGVADFDGDGRDDVLLRRTDGQWAYAAMDGRRRIADRSGWVALPRDPDWRIAGTGDFDGDGVADVLLRNRRGGWRLYPMDGRHPDHERAFAPTLTRHTAWQAAGIGDFDGDGADDVLMRHARGVWRYQTVEARARAGGAILRRLPRTWSWRLAGIGDLDGDGADDILLRDRGGAWRVAGTVARDAATQPVDLPADPGVRLPRGPVHIPDDALRRAVADALGSPADHWITDRDLAGLEALTAADADIADLSGLGSATALARLDVSGNAVGDLSPLAGLIDLAALDASRNAATDLAPLAELPGLVDLDLSSNGVESASPLAGLAGLQSLRLHDNRIGDVRPLTGLTALSNLRLDGNLIEDIAPVARLANLRSLTVANNRIADAGPVSGLTGLERLWLDGNRVADISPLADLRGLVELHLHGNRIEDVGPLSELTALVQLVLAHNRIGDISALAGLTALERLDLDNNRVADISALAGLVSLVRLDLSHNFVADLSPLAALGSLERLDLGYNEVEDVAPLAALTGLTSIVLAYNRIRDLSPLAALPLGEGDTVDVRGNPLGDDSGGIAVATFRAAGANVAVGAPRFVRVHDDNVAVVEVEDVASPDLAAVAWTFHAHFEDAFDFLMVVSNATGSVDRGVPGATYVPASNDADGIGLDRFYRREYGSAGRLKGIVHFAFHWGPYWAALHETAHAWANFVLPTVHEYHWGFSSAAGQLGGFDPADLVALGGGRYAAGEFGAARSVRVVGDIRVAGASGTGGQGGNNAPYGPMELYLAGFLPAEEVPDLWVALDGAWLKDADGADVFTQDGRRVFSAAEVRTYSVDDIVARHGARTPPAGDAQTRFRAAFVLLVDADHPATDETLDLVSESAAWFGLPGDDGMDWLYNFHEATGGRASMTTEGLGSATRPEHAAPSGLPASFGRLPGTADHPAEDV